jgi:hypothetical protein
MSTSRLSTLLTTIDDINNEDPHTVQLSNGTTQAKEYIYGHHMSACLAQYWPDASEFLQIAVRAQHIKRWHLLRSDFDLGKAGYFKWRKSLGKFHAELTYSLMLAQTPNGTGAVAYTEAEAEQTAAIIRKEKLKTSSDSQTLEDVACLVFLQHYFDEFSTKHTEEKVVKVLQKTWVKMSDTAHNIALSLTLPDHLAKLVSKALG